MKLGEVVAGRFLLQRLVGEGGSSKVFQAFDRAMNQTVALKVLSLRNELGDQRFRAEARILADLSHPGVVGYISHGETAQAESFIAMQWLEGETLSERLERGRLSVAESVGIIRQTAEALAEAHARGLVHRDLKPSNLFLVEGSADKVKVLDFGIAKFVSETGMRTGTGTFLGTVGYMAPEQAVAARDVDARADVFALGCVLVECLTGRPAFVAEHAVALLAKVLTEPSPRLGELVPELRGPLDALCARMLAKDPAERPTDAGALLHALDALADEGGPLSQSPASLAPSLTGLERRVVSVALVQPQSTEKGLANYAATHALAGEFGADVTLLMNGALLLVLSGRGSAVDRATRAASFTLAVRRLEPDAHVVLSTGWAGTSSRAPVGPVIDRAAALLHDARSGGKAPAGVLLDTTTARLLSTRFEIVETESGSPLLIGELSADEPPPKLLGKATPCVGRERELTLLVSALSECATDRSPRAVLVTADAGVGKSRLAREFAGIVRREGHARLLWAKSDSTGAGSAFLLARQLITGSLRLPEGLGAGAVHAALTDRLAAVEPRRAPVYADFLCEMLGLNVTTDPGSVLSSARGDARLMSEWMRRSFEEWLAVEAETPLVIVLEDLHWGDAPTVTYVGDTLAHRELPLMVLALARKEVHDAFPNLWAGAPLEVIGLAGLRRRAAEELVRTALPAADPATIRRVVERANGNAFYLEELIRAVADGHGDSFPESVVAMAQAGLERLDPALRRVLRAASVFGERFSAAGATAILGGEYAVREALRVLEEREFVSALRGGDTATDDRQYAFRHALVRDAAYETFTDEDRATAHLLAAEWLGRSSGTDPVVMAEHLEGAGVAPRAVPYLVRAAERAYAAGSPADTRRFAARGIPHAQGEDLGALELLDGASALLEGDFKTAASRIQQAKPLLDPASDRWFLGVSTLAYVRTVAGDPAAAVGLVEEVMRLPALPIANPLCAFGIARGVLTLSFAGQVARTRTLMERVDAESRRVAALNPSSRAWLQLAHGFSFMASACTLEDSVALGRNTVDLFDEAHDDLAIPSALCWLAATRGCVGAYAESVAVQKDAIARAEAGGNLISPSLMKPLLELGRALGGAPLEALDELARHAGQSNPLGESVLLWARGYVLFLLGRLEEAEIVSRAAVAANIPISAHAARATLARVRLERGAPDEALVLAATCVESELRDPFFLSSDAPVVRAEALFALSRTEEARAAITTVEHELRATAERLPEHYAESYLGAVPQNARALTLAATFPAWGGR